MSNTNKRIYSDLDLNFTKNPITGDINILQGDVCVIKSIENLCLTNFYERLFQHHIGGNLNQLLFENITQTTSAVIAREIKNVIQNFEPRATQLQINVTNNIQQNGYNVYFAFFIDNSVAPVEINTFLERLG